MSHPSSSPSVGGAGTVNPLSQSVISQISSSDNNNNNNNNNSSSSSSSSDFPSIFSSSGWYSDLNGISEGVIEMFGEDKAIKGLGEVLDGLKEMVGKGEDEVESWREGLRALSRQLSSTLQMTSRPPPGQSQEDHERTMEQLEGKGFALNKRLTTLESQIAAREIEIVRLKWVEEGIRRDLDEGKVLNSLGERPDPNRNQNRNRNRNGNRNGKKKLNDNGDGDEIKDDDDDDDEHVMGEGEGEGEGRDGDRDGDGDGDGDGEVGEDEEEEDLLDSEALRLKLYHDAGFHPIPDEDGKFKKIITDGSTKDPRSITLDNSADKSQFFWTNYIWDCAS